MRKIAAIAFIELLFIAYAKPVTPITPEAGAKLIARSVSIVKREKPDFSAFTAGKGAFGLFGAAAMVKTGNEIIQNHNVEDPADYIAASLQEALTSQYGTQKSPTGITTTSNKYKQICTENPNADLILDVKTNSWMFVYFPTKWSKYRVVYSASMQFIDNKTQQIIAEGFASLTPDATPDAPTHDELLANNAERLKQELKKAAEFCLDNFKSKVLLIKPTPLVVAQPDSGVSPTIEPQSPSEQSPTAPPEPVPGSSPAVAP